MQNGPHKWLNLERYFRQLRNSDNVAKIHYFTAEVVGPSLANQRAYLRALATLPTVQITLGRFKRKQVRCRVQACAHQADRHFSSMEEKRTDVAIALQIVVDAFQNNCDRFVIVSGDSDLVPAVHWVKTLFPRKEVIVYVPTRHPTRGAAVELRAAADKSKDLPIALLRHSQFPAQLSDQAGGVIDKPAGW